MTTFRPSFGRVAKAFNWYPKHMNTGLKQMQAKLRSVDCILELHDARIPFSGRNPQFGDRLVRDKPHILILNKVDLIGREQARKVKELILAQDNAAHVIFTNSKNDQDQGIKKITPLMKKLIEDSDRFHRSFTQEYHAMIIGVPNVGKSSLINMLRAKNLRKGRALKVGPSAGVTKCVHEKVRISANPEIFLFDTPGILTPRIDGDETGMKLAVCGNLPDHDVGQMLIADYILYTLNKNGCKRYYRYAGMDEPSDCITTVLTKACLHLNIMNNVKAIDVSEGSKRKPNFDEMAKIFIEKFRTGEFGKYVLDDLQPSVAHNFRQMQLLPNETFVSS